jgi:hypothetical protein
MSGDITLVQSALRTLDMTHIVISKNELGKRYRDAIAISQGACNPSGVARSLVAAIDEFARSADYRGTDSVCQDTAVRLICHQLAFLLNVDGLNSGGIAPYTKAVEEVEAKIRETDHG